MGGGLIELIPEPTQTICSRSEKGGTGKIGLKNEKMVRKIAKSGYESSSGRNCQWLGLTEKEGAKKKRS
jgi:hypothetical protein